MPTSIPEPLSSPSPVIETLTMDAMEGEKPAMNKVKTKSIERAEKRRKLVRHGKSKESHPEFHDQTTAKTVKSPRGKKATKAYIPNNTSTSFHATTSRNDLPEISRKFMVTHTSDNWKIRKGLKNNAAKENKEVPPLTSSPSPSNQKSPQHSMVPEPENRIPAPSEPPPIKVEESPSSDFLSKLIKRRMSADDVILQRHKQSVDNILQTLGVREQKLSSIADRASANIPALISPRGSFLNLVQAAPALEEETASSGKTSQSSSTRSSYRALEVINELDSDTDGDQYFDAFHGQVITHKSQFDEGFGGEEEEDEDEFDKKGGDDLNDVDDESSGFNEPGLEGSMKRLPLLSDDFDTDLEESDSEPEEETKGNKNRRKVLKTYKTACAKYHLDPNPAFMRQLGKNSIDVRNRMLTFKDAKPIAIALVADSATSFLDLSENSLGPEGTAYIAEMMYANRSIIELNMSQTEPGREGLVALVQTLPHNPVLRRLYLDNNSLQQRDGDLLARLISSSQDLRELYVNNNTLGFHGIKQIAHALSTNQGKLSVLDLQYNNIRTEGAVQIALSLAKNTTLRSLNLAWNGFGMDGCRALASSLGVNKTLRDLDLTCNRLGLRSLEFLVESLKKNRGLTCLKVGNNPMTTEGAKALIVAVTQAKQSGLTEIDLTDIPVDTEFLRLVEKLQETRVIRVLHDSNIHMGTSDMSRAHDGTNLDRFDPVIVLFEYMKKDNLRVIDLFQFFDVKKRDKLSKSDLRAGINTLMIPFTEHGIDQIMKTLDTDKDGFISLDEMMKGYREMDRAVKLRRIKASQKNKPDKGLEDLWQILKEVINKRKTENEKRSGGVSTVQPALGATAGSGDSRPGGGQQRVTKSRFTSSTDRKKL